MGGTLTPVTDGTRKVLQLKGKRVYCRVRRSARARHIRVSIDPRNGLLLVLPNACSVGEGEAFLARKADWVLRHLRQLDEHEQQREKISRVIPESISCQGQELPVRVRHGASAPHVYWDGTAVQVTTADIGAGRRSLAAWLWTRAELRLPDRLCELAAGLGLGHPRRIQVRDQKTRWGSCSRKGTIALNWRLILLPPAVADYVMLHELVHLTEPHHQPRFWRLLAQRCPGCHEHREWLRRNGPAIMREWPPKGLAPA
jgi:predicted metal-dependent hydrolase